MAEHKQGGRKEATSKELLLVKWGSLARDISATSITCEKKHMRSSGRNVHLNRLTVVKLGLT
jgi:hypothetical protein